MSVGHLVLMLVDLKAKKWEQQMVDQKAKRTAGPLAMLKVAKSGKKLAHLWALLLENSRDDLKAVPMVEN